MPETNQANPAKAPPPSPRSSSLAGTAAGRGRTAIRDLRVIAILEGISYLLLLGIAMPLKYFAGMPETVRVTGAIHGGLFLLYVAAVFRAGILRRWPVRRWIENLVASLLPFGPFLVEPRLRREQHELERRHD